MQPLFYRLDIERRVSPKKIENLYRFGFARDDKTCQDHASGHSKRHPDELIIGVWTCDLRQPIPEYGLLEGRGLGKHGTITVDKADKPLISAHATYKSKLKPKGKASIKNKARLTRPEAKKETKEKESKAFHLFSVYSADSYLKRYLENQKDASY